MDFNMIDVYLTYDESRMILDFLEDTIVTSDDENKVSMAVRVKDKIIERFMN